jgi:hypothetical protein
VTVGVAKLVRLLGRPRLCLAIGRDGVAGRHAAPHAALLHSLLKRIDLRICLSVCF